MNLHSQRAFTLVELMITLALLAIFASVAVPAFAEFISRNRQQALQDEMLAALHFTRAQAILSNSVVEICASSNGAACQTSWSQGWIIRQTSSGDLLRINQQAPGTALRWRGFGQNVRFASNGTSFASNGAFYECNQHEIAWLILLNRQGRARIGNAADKHQRLHYCVSQDNGTESGDGTSES